MNFVFGEQYRIKQSRCQILPPVFTFFNLSFGRDDYGNCRWYLSFIFIGFGVVIYF